MVTAKEIEDFNYKKYEHDFPIDYVSMHKDTDEGDYFRKLLDIKLGYVRKYCAGKKVLDIGCGSGDYLFELKDIISSGYGIDYTDKSIDAANSKKAGNLKFIKANARQLPFEAGAFDLVFSFSALAYMPQLQEVVDEIKRVLRPDGVAILEMGNQHSLNTIVCASYPEYTKPCHISIKTMEKMMPDVHWEILEWHAFGILPFWGRKPGWLRPLLNPVWKEFFQQKLGGRMLDEWVSNIFLFKPWAYRQFIIAKKVMG